MHRYQELRVWQKSIELAVEIYKLTKGFPKEELYGISSQMRRCSVSIASNIAEGAGRKTKGEFSHFLGIALGSANELDTQCEISSRLNYLSEKELKSATENILEIKNMIHNLIKSLN